MNAQDATAEIEILIVEDSRVQAAQLRHLLEENNYRVTVATNGKEALVAVQHKLPTLIISDIMMPEMNGYELCTYLKADPAFNDIPVILLTSLSDPYDIIKGLQAGADNFLTKPYDAQYLLSRIHYMLVNRDLRQRGKTGMVLEIIFGDHKYSINSERQQILDLLLSVYEAALVKNQELIHTQDELRALNDDLEERVRSRTAALTAEIAERTRAEAALRKAEAKYRRLVEWIPAIIYTTALGEADSSVYAGPQIEAVLGFHPSEWTTDADLRMRQLHPDDRERVLAEYAQSVASDQPFRTEYRLITRDDRVVWIRDEAVFEHDLEAHTEYMHGLMLDITERKWAEEEIHNLNSELEQRVIERTAQLESANKDLEAFAYSVSHDLRAPLRAINGFSHIVAESFSDQLPEKAIQYLTLVQNNANKMDHLIEDLLAFSRLGHQPLRKKTILPAALAREVLADLLTEESGRQVDIALDELPPCEADPALLRQVFVNLISNALKYTRRQAAPRIQIGYQQSENETVYFVADNGIGFDMKYANKLFGVFQRLHNAEDYEGTGVGLANVQRIIARHGGRIWAEAEVDQGAIFYFTLAS